MVIDKTDATVAYRCPGCGMTVKSVVGIFSLTADAVTLKCPCGGSKMDIQYTKDRKVRLTVPCFLCPNPHSYTLSRSVFTGDGAVGLTCPYSGVEICFIGDGDDVSRRIEESDRELAELLGDADPADLGKLNEGERTLTDPQVLEIVTYVVHELRDEGKLFCGCEDGGDYEVEIGDDSVTVRCKKCGRSATVPATSVTDAHAFLNADSLTLS